MQTFNVKDGSVQEFFSLHAVDYEKVDRNSVRHDTSAYLLMKDTILLRISAGLEQGEFVVFELVDKSYGSKRDLINTYTYTVEPYDDVCVELRLTNFEISLKEQ